METNVAVVGAGIAGLTAAQQLSRNGINATILDKSPGIDGRMVTRRMGSALFDHGAQLI